MTDHDTSPHEPQCFALDLETDLVGLTSRIIRLEDTVVLLHQQIAHELQQLNATLEARQ